MIIIEEENYIGEGGLQKCYIHPDDDNLCLKVVKEKNHPKSFRLAQEVSYYKKIQRKKNIPFISKYRKEVNTNLGKAWVYDLVKDETTNKVSLTLYDYLKMKETPFSDDFFISKLNELKENLIEKKIMVRDLTAKNICCKLMKDGSMLMVVIDGIGHRDFFPFVDWFRFFAKKKIDKLYLSRKFYSMPEHLAWLAIHAPDKVSS